MGVKGLNRFITKFEKSVMEPIDIGEVIDDWKVNHDDKAPEILIDLKEIAHMFVQRDEIGVILGGLYNYYNKMLRMMLENFKQTGGKLVLFMPARKYTDELPFFIPKTEDNYMSSLKILDEIRENGRIQSLQQMLHEKNKISADIRMELSFNHNLKKMVRRYGEVHINYIRHNQEIALYAKEHADRVLAVISNDTDFMAFEGDFEYWPSNRINFKEMTGMRFNKRKLYEKLDFEHGPYQMQLLSALCGSNFLPIYSDISEFINKLSSLNEDPLRRGKILIVAGYVKQQTYKMVDNKPKYDLKKISRDVFGDDFIEDQYNAISNGLECYNLNFKQTFLNDPLYRDPTRGDSFLKFCQSCDLFIFKLATDDIFRIRDITYMDFRNIRTKTYSELVIPLLMKMCGILNKDKSRRPLHRKICAKHAHDEPSKVTEECIIYPPMGLPPLFDLIFKNKEKERFEQFRWPLIQWILDLDDDFMKKLREKPVGSLQKLFAVVVTLQYLIQQEELTKNEATVILYTEQTVRIPDGAQRDHPKSPEILNPNFIRIAHLYVKMYVLISHCIDICGLHEMTEYIRFEARHFHQKMERISKVEDIDMDRFVKANNPFWIF